jgi:hypothetical protein
MHLTHVRVSAIHNLKFPKEITVINLGLMDIVLLLALVIMYVYSRRIRSMVPFFIVVAVLVLIEVERLLPGLFAGLVHGMDAINAQLPHVQISPIVTIK